MAQNGKKKTSCGVKHGSHGPHALNLASSDRLLPPFLSGPNGAAPSPTSSVSVLLGRACAGTILEFPRNDTRDE